MQLFRQFHLKSFSDEKYSRTLPTVDQERITSHDIPRALVQDYWQPDALSTTVRTTSSAVSFEVLFHAFLRSISISSMFFILNIIVFKAVSILVVFVSLSSDDILTLQLTNYCHFYKPTSPLTLVLSSLTASCRMTLR